MINLLKNTLLTLLVSSSIFLLLNYLYPLDTSRLYKPNSTIVYDRNHKLVAIKLSSDEYLRIPIKGITPDIKRIVLGYEDRYFYSHFGINPLSIVRALWSNLTNSSRIGASTITMQVARMMHHKPRTLTQKLIEMFRAVQLELQYSKEEILTLYLNNAPYGGNVEGFASASFKYFNLPPTSLSLSQIAYLTTIPKNPNANRPKRGRDINGLKAKLLKRLYSLNIISQKEYQKTLSEEIYTDIRSLPNRVPHLVSYINSGNEVNITLDLRIQDEVQKIISSHVKELEKFGIHNGSAIIIDNSSMEILTYVASQNFYDRRYGGENDGLRALISPASTLKPLIYAKALEMGLITPLKKVYDVPLFLDGYKPTNYSKTYLGEITASEALQFSLNIPAVELDRELGKNSLYYMLREANISSLNRAKSYYGSSLALGGFGLSLRNGAELFATLANGGIYQKSSIYPNQKYPKRRILSPQATYLVSNILADAPRSELSSSWEFVRGISKVAFKTGTSAHARDLLTIGYTPKYTVGVWYGNFSGKPTKPYQGRYATGLYTSSPTLFKIFRLLGGGQGWFSKPQGVSKRSICQDGIVLGECKHRVQDYTIDGVELKRPCLAMRAEVLSYLIESGAIDSIASLSSHRCYSEWKSYKPLITSPIHNKKYTYNKFLPNELKKMALQCYSFDKNSTIYWLIDNQPPIVSKSGKKIYIYLAPEKHNISCLDEGAKMRTITVESEEI